ncbi:MAG: indole-3-glycerol phosphate synthase TrpC [Ruminococcus sp.]|jgi:indole-3-glycerol phosphate synthase|nr:indole-3-glycerol phosphate synthase TrpC [Ruminococcus sp.]
MKDILSELAKLSRQRLDEDMKKVSFSDMRRQAEIAPDMPSFYEAISKPGLSFICEVKKASPSKGIIAEDFDYEKIASDYEKAGADAVSVLTEPYKFLGSDEYLKTIAKNISKPCLRKDFTVSDYQIYQAKTLGAAAVLLIVRILDREELREYIEIAEGIGLDALVECHDEIEIQTALRAGAKIIGVNNRNLRTFDVDIHNSKRLRKLVPNDLLFVSESGIKNNDDIIDAVNLGADAVLVGEALMRSKDKAKTLSDWRNAICQNI